MSKNSDLSDVPIFFKKLLEFFSLIASVPKTLIFFEVYLKLEIFMSKQYMVEFGKNFTNAAAEAPAYDPISSIFNFLCFNFFKNFK